MPKLTSSFPRYRRHKASGQAVVTLSSSDIYLGPWGTKISQMEYDRVVTEWVNNGRRLSRGDKYDITVVEIISPYLKYANAYYVKDGHRTQEACLIADVMTRFVQPMYGRKLAADFGPCALKAIRQKMIEANHSRGFVNKNIQRIRRMFRWAAAEEMVHVTVYQALATLPGLRMGRTEAREAPPIQPVDGATVDATIESLPAVVADMVQFQRLTGCRPGEVCQLRPMDVDRSSDVWVYRPASHKTQHNNRERLIFIGPKAKAILTPYLLRDAHSYCFSPVDSEAKRHAEMRSARKTPVQPSQQNRCKTGPKRQPRTVYSRDIYRRAVARAVERANKERDKKKEKLLPHWHPNQLRHSTATEIRKHYGLEAAQAVLGHARADVTQVYAERDQALAEEIMQKIG